MPSVRPGGRGHLTLASVRRGRSPRLLVLALLLASALGATLGMDQPAARAADGPSGALAVPRGHELWAVVAASGADRLLATRPTTAAVLDAAWADSRRLVFAQLDLPRGSDPGARTCTGSTRAARRHRYACATRRA